MSTTWTTRLSQNLTPAGAYRTQCKECELAIFAGQPTVWQTKPMGQSHQACVDAKNAVAEAADHD